ncbi:glycosyltransferase WbuB [Candidatus Marinamargulisbacteria bacterium SCGC AG-410-N11]|nr:glycosyltransferase WbuB [Candidatus Marinamargulisbacteria bacterium SCGC AG-410-N11]
MKITIITHYFPPEVGAPQARLSEMALEWSKLGHDVTILTCFPNHPNGVIHKDYRGKRFLIEKNDHYKVVRTWVYATPNKGFIKKILGHLSFMFSCVLQGRKHVKGSDIIIASSPTFFCVISAYFLSKCYKIPYIFEVRDLWPAIFKDLGILKNNFILSILETIELFLYKNAKYVVTVTDRFTKNICERGIEKDKVFTITNGVDLNRFFPIEKNQDLIKELKLSNKFIVLYIGAHGVSQGLNTIIDAAHFLSGYPDIHFLFVGEGADKESIINKSKELNLHNTTFLGNQPKEKVASFYSIMDVGLIPLKNISLFETFIPSKMFEMLAMKKPIIASVLGESKDILTKSKAAITCFPENVSEISEAIINLYNNKNLQKELSDSGFLFVSENYNRKILAQNYLNKIKL